MLNLLKKANRLRFAFSNLERFNAAQQIFKTIYNHDQHIKEDFDKKKDHQIFQMLIQNQKQTKPRSLLSDHIRQSLNRIKTEGKISQAVANEIMDLFNPTKGMKLQSIPFAQLQPERFNGGVNQSMLFPLNPNSSVMKYILKQMFSFGKGRSHQFKEPAFFMSGYPLYITHLKGTPGFGKSACLLTAKYILDLRIKHLIETKGSTPSIFGKEQNYKLLYFNANIKKKEIEKEIIRNIESDFGNQSQELKQFLNKKNKNMSERFQFLQDAYDQKNIKLIVVIDQVNSLYKLNTRNQISKRKKIVDTWKCLRDYCDGFFLISSKNNPYEKNFDPVAYVAFDETKIEFSNMDNFISPEARLSYSIECMIFEIEKLSIDRKSAVQMVQYLGQIPLLSHLAIRLAVKQFQKCFKNKILSKLQKDDIIKALNKNQDISKMQKNINELEKLQTQKLKSQELKTGIFYAIRMMGYISNFTTKKARDELISSQLKLTVQDQEKIIKKQLMIKSRSQAIQLKDKGRIKESLELSDVNFFFKGYRFKKYLQKQDEGKVPIQNRYFACLSLRQIENIRLGVAQQIYYVLLRVSELNLELAYQFAQQIVCDAYQNMICGIFEEHRERKEKNQLKVTIKVFRTFYGLSCNSIFPTKIKFDKNIDESNLTSLVDYMTKQGKQGFYVRADDGNQAFDFLLSSFDSGNLNIFLVDVTLSFNQNLIQKVKKFYSYLNKKLGLDMLISKCHQQTQVKTINIYYIALQGHKNYYLGYQKAFAETFEIFSKNQQKSRPDRIKKFQQDRKKIMDINADRCHFTQTFDIRILDKQTRAVMNSNIEPVKFLSLAKSILQNSKK